MQESVPPKGLQRCRAGVAVEWCIRWLVSTCTPGPSCHTGQERSGATIDFKGGITWLVYTCTPTPGSQTGQGHVQAVTLHRDPHQALLSLQVATNSLQELPLVLQRGEGVQLKPDVQGCPPFQLVGQQCAKLKSCEEWASGLIHTLSMCSSSQLWGGGAAVYKTWCPPPLACWPGP